MAYAWFGNVQFFSGTPETAVSGGGFEHGK
jgi:hypothetical protein